MALLGPVTSSEMAANMAAISDFTKIQIYRKMFFPKVVKYKYDTFNSLLLSVAIYLFIYFHRKKGEKRAFVFKNGLTLETGHYLLPVCIRGFFLRHNNFCLNPHLKHYSILIFPRPHPHWCS